MANLFIYCFDDSCFGFDSTGGRQSCPPGFFWPHLTVDYHSMEHFGRNVCLCVPSCTVHSLARFPLQLICLHCIFIYYLLPIISFIYYLIIDITLLLITHYYPIPTTTSTYPFGCSFFGCFFSMLSLLSLYTFSHSASDVTTFLLYT